jgi:hypothetical protein
VAVAVTVLVAALVAVGVAVVVDAGVGDGVAVAKVQIGSSQLLPSANTSPTAQFAFAAAICSGARPAVAPHESWISRI